MTNNPKYKDNLIANLTFDFAVEILKLSEKLEDKKKFVVAKQLARSGTSVGANVREAQNAESKLDFIHKIKIATKEADETEYWLLLCKELEYASDVDKLLIKLESILKVLTKIISSSKNLVKSSAN